MEYKIETIEKLLKEKTQTQWTGYSNIPFDAHLERPAPSLSKYAYKDKTSWRVADVEFVLWCANGGVQMLLDEIKNLRDELKYADYEWDEI